MFESHRTPQRPALIEIAATVFAAVIVAMSIVGIVVSIDGAGDVVRASRAFVPRPAAAMGRVYVEMTDPEIVPSSIGHGQPSEPTIVRDGPVACPDPSLSDASLANTVGTGAGAGPVAPCDRDR